MISDESRDAFSEASADEASADEASADEASADKSDPRPLSTMDRAMEERRSRTVSGATQEGEPDVAVLVPAAGAGTRMGGDTRKQFRELGGESLLVQTLRTLERCASVGHLIVAVPGRDLSSVTDRLQAAQLRKLTAVVEGGETRQDSVRNALRAVPKPVRVVLVHDGVRPFVPRDRVAEVVQAVRATGAASLAVPVADTLRRGHPTETDAPNTDTSDIDAHNTYATDASATDADDLDNRALQFGETVDRDGLFRMQTPQGFRREWLEKAHRTAREGGVIATDDVELVQRLGHDVICVEGSAYNIKITTPTDWTLAQALWSAGITD